MDAELRTFLAVLMTLFAISSCQNGREKTNDSCHVQAMIYPSDGASRFTVTIVGSIEKGFTQSIEMQNNRSRVKKSESAMLSGSEGIEFCRMVNLFTSKSLDRNGRIVALDSPDIEVIYLDSSHRVENKYRILGQDAVTLFQNISSSPSITRSTIIPKNADWNTR